LPQSSLATSFLVPPLIDELQDGVQRGKALPTIMEDHVQDHLRNLNIQKSMGPDEMHPRVLRELADVIAKTLYDISKVVEVPADWRKGNIVPIFKKGRKEDPGNY